MKKSEADTIADRIAELPSRSFWSISEAVQALYPRNGEKLHEELQRDLVGPAVPLVRTEERILYADIDVETLTDTEATDERAALQGTAIILTDDLVITLRMSAKQDRDAWLASRSVESSASAVRRSDIRKVVFEGVHTKPSDEPNAEWKPNGSVTLHMREGQPIKLEAFDGAAFADLGGLLSR